MKKKTKKRAIEIDSIRVYDADCELNAMGYRGKTLVLYETTSRGPANVEKIELAESLAWLDKMTAVMLETQGSYDTGEGEVRWLRELRKALLAKSTPEFLNDLQRRFDKYQDEILAHLKKSRK